MTVNYDKEMVKIIKEAKGAGKKPTLLLHACCAPCSSAAIERLKDDCDITAYFYNPNLDGKEEFKKRAKEAEKLCAVYRLPLIKEEYNPEEFYDKIKGYENCPEGGERCFICYKLRLKRAAKYAKEHGFDYFATSLTLSPLKNARVINETGYKVAEEENVKYLPSDFKKRDGYLVSIKLSAEYGLYRQNYCGCVFSEK